MTNTQIAANAAPDYAINHLLRCRDRSNSKQVSPTSAVAREGADAHAIVESGGKCVRVDIAPGELGSLLPQGGFAIVDGGDRVPTAGRVYWVVVQGEPVAMRCVASDPRSFAPIASADNEAPLAPLKWRAAWAVLGRVISYGAEVDA